MARSVVVALFYTVTSRPTRQKITELVTGEAATKWNDIGIKLLDDEYVNKLSTIKSNYPDNVQICCEKMFILWLAHDNGATWDKLLTALKAVGLNALAATITTSTYVQNGYYKFVLVVFSWL